MRPSLVKWNEEILNREPGEILCSAFVLYPYGKNLNKIDRRIKEQVIFVHEILAS